MKISSLKWILILLLAAMGAGSGCSSLDKAKSLHRKGETAQALTMAQDLLDDDEDNKTRLGAIALLAEIGGDRSGEILMPVLDDEVIAVKNAAITVVGKIAYGPASEKLLKIGMSSKGETFETPEGFTLIEARKYGAAMLHFLKQAP